MEKLKIGIIDDDEKMLDYLSKVINSSSKMECTMYTTSVEAFFQYISSNYNLNILLLDIDLPGMSGLEAVSKIKFKLPNTSIVILTSFSDKESIFHALRSGASGYLLKTESPVKICEKILLLEAEGAPLSSNVAKKLISWFNPPANMFKKYQKKNKLTKTEKVVVSILIKGLTYQEMADDLNISINGIRSHIRNIYRKLEVNSRAKIMEKYKNYDINQL